MFLRTLCLCSLVLASTACGFRGAASPLSDLSKTDDQKDYVVGAGDQLNLKVWREPELSGPVNVREDGKFTMPFIKDVQAAGKTTDQIAQDVTERLAAFVEGATVIVTLDRQAPVVYYLLGSFNRPGEFRNDRKVTFLQAVATGGSFLPYADESSVVLIRKTSSGEFRYVLDYNRVVEGKEPNFELKHGDILEVH